MRTVSITLFALVGALLLFQYTGRLGKDDPVTVTGDDRDRPLSTAVAAFRAGEIVEVLPPDAIPSIDDPELVPAEEADELEGDEFIIGVELEGEARAYPIRVLSAHEIVNDQIHGRPIAVTW